MKRHATCAFLAACLLAGLVLCPPSATAETMKDTDATSLPQTPQGERRASMETMQIPSHGALMNALVYVAAGAGPHPTVVLLHGFPGNERNLDLAQDIRRAGWNVLYFNYRGSWGTPGDFSFSHGVEDVASALAYLRQPENARRLRIDTTRIVLIGHSMGGFMAVQAGAADPAVKAIGMISAADMAGRFQELLGKGTRQAAIQGTSTGLADEGMAPLSGCTPDGLAQELAGHARDWRFLSKVAALKDRPALVITSDDGLTPWNDAFSTGLRKAGDHQVTTLHLATDHAYSDKRTELSHAVLAWLAPLAK
ncbi:alpha/beta hydrolase [Dyella sp. EPa41]|uniref:alpha/beta hydrolase family protein n=1 Tax=Dyella sp. EPa41 TaxID=1561194 RepID=UPI001F1C45EC|nr:alpha/beta hydrolase [Dyella sp. EPa41]